MLRLLKTLLLWMLFAALPLQGIAASIGMSCGRAHDEAAPAVAAAGHHHPGMQGGEAMTVAHLHATDHGGAHAQPQPDSHSHPHPHSHSSCSACAACCTGASAPPLTITLPPAPAAGGSLQPLPLPLFAGVVPAGIERPPRTVSA